MGRSLLLVTAVALISAVFLSITVETVDAKRSRICMVDHFHYGTGSSAKKRKYARLAAYRSWAEFAAFEYGSAWSSFKFAASRGETCQKSGGVWHCQVEGRPCRR